jgi:hypothetical protein
MKTRLLVVTTVVAAAMLLAACGGGHDHETTTTAASEGGHGGHEMAAAGDAQGLRASDDGFTVKAPSTTLPTGRVADYRFQIVDKHGMAIRDYEVDQQRKLHLIVVRRDFAGYQHLHPKLGSDGTWSVPLKLAQPGRYRAFADFTVEGKRRMLGLDLRAPGSYRPQSMEHETTISRTGPYEVKLEGAMPRARQEGEVSFAVTEGSKPVHHLEEYLGAKGHLVALRHGDLAYLHVHPQSGGAANAIPFMAQFPSAGPYQLFLQFKADGKVRTAPFTLHVQR